MNIQLGGDCSLCGAKKANKATCPFNPSAKNPNADKHNKKQKNMKTKKNSTKRVNAKTSKKPKSKTIKKIHTLKPNMSLKLAVYNNQNKRVQTEEKDILKYHSVESLKDFIKYMFYGLPLHNLKINKEHNKASFHIKLDELISVGREYAYLDNPNEVTNVKDGFSEIYENIVEVGKEISMPTKYGPNGKLNSKYSIETLLE